MLGKQPLKGVMVESKRPMRLISRLLKVRWSLMMTSSDNLQRALDTPISDLFKAHPELHHYTTWQGLEGICSSKSLWATYYANLNDSTEFTHILQYLERHLLNLLAFRLYEVSAKSLPYGARVARRGGPITVASKLSKEYITQLFSVSVKGEIAGKASFRSPYICSFCSHSSDSQYEREHGLLSQWRAYGGRESYCLVFDTAEIWRLLKMEVNFYTGVTARLTSVVYDEGYDQFLIEYAPVVEQIFKYVDNVLAGRRDEELLSMVLTNISSAASYFKHRGFREEREVRIVYYLNSDVNAASGAHKLVKSRGANSEIKYVALFDRGEKFLPIKRIIVGPHNDQKGLGVKVQTLVGNDVDVHFSATPYVQPAS
jgi:hypothetical protein